MMTVKKSTLLVASFIFAGMVSCNADTSDKDPIIVDETSSSSTTTDYTATQYSVAPELTSTPAAAQTVALNPAHGQPGHDCAIPVGAPLGGAAAGSTAASAKISTPPPVTPLSGPIPKFNAALNVNPAHGQPGHDCSVAVGAPLPGSSAGITTAPARVPTTPASSSPLGGPIPKFNANVTINPAHGQPGHDCAVAVGAPLPSK